jgi:hypothetical protein
MDWKEVAEAVRTLGFPIVALVILGYGCWQALLYAKTVVERIVDRHLKFIDRVETAVLAKLEVVVERLEAVADDTSKVRNVVVKTEHVVIEHPRKP